MERTDERVGRPTAQLMMGLVLILVGIALMLDRITILGIEGRWWPFIPLALGAVKFIAPSASGRGTGSSRRSGAWLLFFGLWGLVNEFHLFGLDYATSWPLMIVGVGIMIVWRAFEGPNVCARSDARRQEP